MVITTTKLPSGCIWTLWLSKKKNGPPLGRKYIFTLPAGGGVKPLPVTVTAVPGGPCVTSMEIEAPSAAVVALAEAPAPPIRINVDAIATTAISFLMAYLIGSTVPAVLQREYTVLDSFYGCGTAVAVAQRLEPAMDRDRHHEPGDHSDSAPTTRRLRRGYQGHLPGDWRVRVPTGCRSSGSRGPLGGWPRMRANSSGS